MHYNYFRDYDPSTGRYIQFDPIGVVLYRNMAARNLAAMVDPVSPELAALLYSSVPIYNHPYGYGANDPISQIDPFGLANSGPWPKPKPTPPRKPSELPYDSTYASCAQYPGGTCEGKSLNSLCKTFGTDPNSNCARKCLQVSLPPGGGDDPPISWYIPQHPVCWYECGWPGGWR